MADSGRETNSAEEDGSDTEGNKPSTGPDVPTFEGQLITNSDGKKKSKEGRRLQGGESDG